MAWSSFLLLVILCGDKVNSFTIIDSKSYCKCGVAGDYICRGLEFGSQDIAFSRESSLSDCRDVYIEQSDLTTIPKFAFEQTLDTRRFFMERCNLKQLFDWNFQGSTYRLEVLNLDDNQLEKIPSRVFSNLQRLHELSLMYNNIKTLEEDCFAGLINLETLRLDGNNIEHLPELIFAPLPGLITISLSKNGIKHLPDLIFANITNLQYVYLDKNNLNIIDGNTPAKLQLASGHGDYTSTVFLHLPYARHIDLSGNYFPYMSKTIFSRLRNLQYLLMDGANVSYIEEGSFSNLHDLTVLSLAGNHLRSFDVNLLDRIRMLFTLKLHGNRLSNLDYTRLPIATRIITITLRNNFWSCDTLDDMKRFFSVAGILADLDQDVCLNETTTEMLYTEDTTLRTESTANPSYSDNSGSSALTIGVSVGALLFLLGVLYCAYQIRKRSAA